MLKRRWVAVAAIMLLALVLWHSLASANPRVRMVTLPGDRPARLATRLIDEQQASLLGAWVVRNSWHLSADERVSLVAAMRAAYAAMHDDLGDVPTPMLDTLMRRQRVTAFDTLVIEPPTTNPPRAAVIFLHGYAGSFALECWLVAQAAYAIGAVTVCPATSFAGHWEMRDGQRIVSETLRHVHARGIDRIYLAGLSNGGVGAIALAPRFASALRGLIAISGASATGNSAGLPTLVLHGDHDPMASTSAARAFATRAHGRYVELAGGHFVLMIQRDAARETIAQWLSREERVR